MMKTRNLLALSSLLIFVGCKTQQDINREQSMDNLSVQMVQGQRLTAEATVKLQALEERLNQMTGRIDETEHTSLKQGANDIEELKKRLTVLEEQQKNHTTELANVNKELKENKKFLEQVLKTLDGLAKKKDELKPAASPYETAMADYGKGRYDAARPVLEGLLNKNQVKGNQKARTLHNLGMIAYMKKEYDNAAVYFSRLVTEHPKATYIPNGLLFLGKTFSSQKDNEKAKAVLEELVSSHPNAKQVAEAKTLLAKM
jgi:TolA-binding protein